MEANWVSFTYIKRMLHLHMIEKCPFIQHVPSVVMKGFLNLGDSYCQIG